MIKFAIQSSIFASVLCIAGISTSVLAQQNTNKNNKAAALSSKSIESYKGLFASKTGMNADEVGPAPLAGFVEVVVGTTVYYMDTTGKWLFDGHIVDLSTRTSVTAVRKAGLEQSKQPLMDWKTLNLADAIKTVRGVAKPGRVLVTFEDPNCGYCKKLSPELEKLTDLTVLVFPISILGADSKAKNESIWCSKDRAAAWNAVMKGADVKAEVTCDLSSLGRNSDLAQKLHVTGTPTLFFADGKRHTGYVDAATIEEKIAAIKKLN